MEAARHLSGSRLAAGNIRWSFALAEGISAAATEAEVRATFPSVEETLHKYLAAPGK